MSDTLVRVAIQVLRNDPNYKLWDKLKNRCLDSDKPWGKYHICWGQKRNIIVTYRSYPKKVTLDRLHGTSSVFNYAEFRR